jgi:hypothetical protein
MRSEGFAYFIAANHISGVLFLIPLVVASARRASSSKPLNAVLVSIMITIGAAMLYHIIQATTFFIHIPQQKGNLVVLTENWGHLTNYYWCAFDAISYILLTTCMGHLGVVLLYIPFSIFISSIYRFNMPLVRSKPTTMFVIVFSYVIGVPATFAVTYGIVSQKLPQDHQFTFDEWHCVPNYKYVKEVGYAVFANAILLGLISAFFAFYSLLQMQKFRGKFAEQAQQISIPADFIVRCFLLYE